MTMEKNDMCEAQTGLSGPPKRVKGHSLIFVPGTSAGLMALQLTPPEGVHRLGILRVRRSKYPLLLLLLLLLLTLLHGPAAAGQSTL